MIYRLTADAVVVFHFLFVAFVMAGGLLVLRWPRVMWVHLPAVAWGIFIELSHGLCPLTPLENHFRDLGGQAGYEGGFVNHYVVPVLYPRGLTPGMQVGIAVFIIVVNATCYALLGYRVRRARAARIRVVAPEVTVETIPPVPGANPQSNR